jgi:hypothetical protein
LEGFEVERYSDEQAEGAGVVTQGGVFVGTFVSIDSSDTEAASPQQVGCFLQGRLWHISYLSSSVLFNKALQRQLTLSGTALLL